MCGAAVLLSGGSRPAPLLMHASIGNEMQTPVSRFK